MASPVEEVPAPAFPIPEIPVPPHERDIDLVLGGSVIVKSYDNTSQYSKAGGPSTCGLASLNALRCTLRLEREGCVGLELVRAMMSRELPERIAEICTTWPSSEHLEVDEISQLPLFSRSLALIDGGEEPEQYEVTFNNFITLFQNLRALSTLNKSAATIITKPPEILAAFAISTNLPHPRPSTIFAIYDSHPRPVHHPNGAAFSFFVNPAAAAGYLTRLLATDPTILNDPQLAWQAQLLSQFSAHFFTASDLPSTSDMDEELFKASATILKLQADLLEMATRYQEEQTRHVRALADLERREAELDVVRAELKETRKAAKKADKEKTKLSQDLQSERKRVSDKERRLKEAEQRSADFISWTDVNVSLPSLNLLDYTPTFIADMIAPPARESHRSSRSKRYSDPRYDSAREDPHHSGLSSKHPKSSTSRRKSYPDDPQPGPSTHHILEGPHHPPIIQVLPEEEEVTESRYEDPISRSTQTPKFKFDCIVCFQSHPEDELARFEGCKHEICRECLADYIHFGLEQLRFPIMCPVCVTEDTGVEGCVTQAVLDISGVSEKDYRRWVELDLGRHSVVLDCRKCHQTVLVDRSDYLEAEILSCPLKKCDNMWCKRCHQTVESPEPEDHTCDGSLELTKLMGTNGWKYCPGCQTPTERTEGCNHMICNAPNCNTHFCYVDGAFIVRTQNGIIAKNAVDEHYRACALFEVPPELFEE